MKRARPADEASRALLLAGGGDERLECPLVHQDHTGDSLVLELRRLEERHAGMVERAFALLEEAITDLEHLG
jgi:hypothetical protein